MSLMSLAKKGYRMKFFMPMRPPTSTHQEKQVNFKTKCFYEPYSLKKARETLRDGILRAVKAKPEIKEDTPYTGPVHLRLSWYFPGESHQWRTQKPDCDNMVKVLLDEMTCEGFWKDDAQIVTLMITKENVPEGGPYPAGIFVECFPGQILDEPQREDF